MSRGRASERSDRPRVRLGGVTGRRIVIDGQTYLLARRQDVISVWDARARRELVEAILDDLAGRFAARRLVESITGGIMLGASDIAQELDRLLERGDLVAVRERGEVRLLDAPTISDLRDLPSDDPDPIAPVESSTWIEIRVVGESGLSAAGTEIRLRLPDGERRSVILDEHATVYVDDIQRPGSCRVEIIGPSKLKAAAGSSAKSIERRADLGSCRGRRPGRPRHGVVAPRRDPSAHRSGPRAGRCVLRHRRGGPSPGGRRRADR